MNQGIWKIYKSKLLKSFMAEEEEEIKEQNNDTVMSTEEGASPVSLLAKKMHMAACTYQDCANINLQDLCVLKHSPNSRQSLPETEKMVQGASAKGWKCMSSIFNKDDEHKLLPAENATPVEHVLSEPAPKEPAPERKLTGFWDLFAAKWNQASVGGEGTDAGSGEVDAASATHSEGSDPENLCSSSQYTNLEEHTDPGFKWNFVTSKLAELKNKSMQKNN
ncbi:LOW QUALITY PROTEIN: uncharacterized protein C1orf232 [Narcine bancroftii]|uniref:LOW QUALITY PROTEIN: uncharacterized protein C1orf232 n=1 Tax=Narcine bancroftii TaxID=1343680 RepID=UPI00383162B1